MVNVTEIKEFCESDVYQSAILELQSKMPNIFFTSDDIQMYNIFSKMVNNSELDITTLKNEIISNLNNLINYGKLRLTDKSYNEDDFSDDYNNEEKSKLISFSYSQLILIQITIEYFFITKRTKDNLMSFIKKQKIPSPKKFLNELYETYSKINIT